MLKFTSMTCDGVKARWEYKSVPDMFRDWYDEENCGTPENDAPIYYLEYNGIKSNIPSGTTFIDIIRAFNMEVNEA